MVAGRRADRLHRHTVRRTATASPAPTSGRYPPTGGAARKLTESNGEASAPAWSPDGRTIAFFGHNEGDKWSATTRVWTVPADGSAPPRCLTQSLDRQVDDRRRSTTRRRPTPRTRPLWSADGATHPLSRRGRRQRPSLCRLRNGRRRDAAPSAASAPSSARGRSPMGESSSSPQMRRRPPNSSSRMARRSGN